MPLPLAEELKPESDPTEDMRLALLDAVPIEEKRSRRLVACSAERSLEVSMRVFVSESELELEGGWFSSDEAGPFGGGIFKD